MKYAIILVSIVCFGLYGQAQSNSYYTEPDDQNIQVEYDSTANIQADSTNTWSMRPELRLGTSIGTFGSTPYAGSFVSPALHIQPPGKFSIIVGASLSFSNSMYHSIPDDSENGYYQKMASYQMYAMGSYRVNENLNVRGGMSVTYFPGNDFSSLQDGYKQGHFGFDLKVSENTWISADFNFGDYNPYQYSPFGTSPYYQSTAMPGFYPYRGF